MNNLSSAPGNILQEESPIFLQYQRNKSPQGLNRIFQWWYQMTSPPEPDDSASFEEKELFRRGRTGSQISIILFLQAVASYPAAFAAGSNPLLIAIITINILTLLPALVLNRLRRVQTAGAIVVLSRAASIAGAILTTPGGINTSTLPIFSLLVLSLMCAVSFLPPWWVFVVAMGNSLFTVLVLKFVPSSGELHGMLKANFVGIVTPIFVSQVIVSSVAFLWVRGAAQALQRADRAEEIASLEHEMVLQGAETVAQQKQQLDQSIQKIVDTHTRVANGDFNARVPLTRDNVLWQISGSLNNLLARLQRLRQDSAKVQNLQLALEQAREENARLKRLLGKDYLKEEISR